MQLALKPVKVRCVQSYDPDLKDNKVYVATHVKIDHNGSFLIIRGVGGAWSPERFEVEKETKGK